MAKEDDRLSVPAIAKLAAVSQETVHNWIDTGKLEATVKYHGLQRRRYVDREKWERFKEKLPSVEPTV